MVHFILRQRNEHWGMPVHSRLELCRTLCAAQKNCCALAVVSCVHLLPRQPHHSACYLCTCLNMIHSAETAIIAGNNDRKAFSMQKEM